VTELVARDADGVGEIGAHRRRREDPRLLRGQGQYVEDLRFDGLLDVAFVRSIHAHARIAAVDLQAAEQVPGVVLAWSGANVREVPRVPSRLRIAELHLSPLPPLAHDSVTMVGYPIAAIVAQDRQTAHDAANLVSVDYTPLPAVTSAEDALRPEAPLLFPELGTNIGYHLVKEGGDVEAAFARADHELSLRIVHPRLAPVPMEPRALVASFDRPSGELTIWRSTQSPFLTRSLVAAVTGRPEDSIRVIAPDVGGAFGAKSALYPDELTTILLALELGAPVRWVSTRVEDLQLTLQGRDQINDVRVAFASDGRLEGLQVRCLHNLGGVLMHPMAAPPLRVTDYATGAYRTPAIRTEVFGVYTTTAPTGPYRGAGRPEAAMIAERAIDAVAAALGRDPIEVRRRNFLQPDQFPYTTPVGSVFDSGNYEPVLNRALELADYAHLAAEQQRQREAARQAGQPIPLVGIGVATTIEISGQGQEYGSLEVEPDGTILARTGSSSHGQGHETSFAQIVADGLGVPLERVRVLHGDTRQTPSGGGTGGSRSLVVGGSALASSATLLTQRALDLAAARLEVAREDLVFRRGGVKVVGVPERRLELGELASTAPDGLRVETSFEPAVGPTVGAVPFGTAVAAVHIDAETGRVHLDRLVVVDDCGTVVNPLIVHGQVAGGLAQGIGEALYEQVVFADGGELLSSSLLDYAVPKASMLPAFELDMLQTPAPNNPLGAKGIGEAGCVTAPPAIVLAVLDALRPLGVTSLPMPLSPERIWRAISTNANKGAV
jgi:carbon-monoxide dehydrogenase large subunit